MNNRFIIISISILIFSSLIFLSYTEKKQAQINTKNTWMIYFKNVKDTSLDFSLENHSNETSFHYEILSDKDKLNEFDINVFNGQTVDIPVSLSNTNGKKITIKVSDQQNSKEIYKIF